MPKRTKADKDDLTKAEKKLFRQIVSDIKKALENDNGN